MYVQVASTLIQDFDVSNASMGDILRTEALGESAPSVALEITMPGPTRVQFAEVLRRK